MKKISVTQAADLIHNGMTVMVGGFLKCGTPVRVIDKLVENNTKELTLIANDTSFVDSDRGKLIAHKQVKHAIVTHIGMNPETGRQMHTGEMAVEIVPQGTLAERIRASGAGLGGILTPTGVGTIVADNKRLIEVDGR
ncbi:MAG: CoA-transferase, partial [Alphaproteobacteria bacterium]